MRVLIVSTSDNTGGAAVAAHRLLDALIENGVSAKMLVRDKTTDDPNVVSLNRRWLSKWYFLWERWCIFLHLNFSKKNLFQIDTGQAGHDITNLPEYKEADIIHLHWINQGMLSLKGIQKILDSGKPVVWTMHDAWPATAICHLTLGCLNFNNECSNCKYLPNASLTHRALRFCRRSISGTDLSTGSYSHNLSVSVWRQKQSLYRYGKIAFVACSRWLAGEAVKSRLLSNARVVSISNPINTSVFLRKDKLSARQKMRLPRDMRLILFVSQRVDNENKGMHFLIEACRILKKCYPDFKNDTGIVVLGGNCDEVASSFSFPVYPMGYVSDTNKIVDIYNAVDMFVMPSLSENLPNTIMESMACGTPCVGFNVGGIPEMIDHKKNGYVAEYRDSVDLAKGIHWVLEEADYDSLSKEAVLKVMREYSAHTVASRYKEVYEEALTANK